MPFKDTDKKNEYRRKWYVANRKAEIERIRKYREANVPVRIPILKLNEDESVYEELE